MNVINSLLTRLRRTLPGRSADSTLQPLLNRKDILDLRYRIEHMATPSEHFRDVAHSMFGDTRSVYRGYGMDYEESRPYQAGDELRYMNWRLTARTGEPYMKVFREERRPGVFIVVDRRGSMRFGSKARLKVTQAVRAAAVAAFGARYQNIPVGGVLLQKDLHWLADETGEQGAFHLVREASSACPPLYSTSEEPSLGHILKLLVAMLTPGSRLYLISDFIDINDQDRSALLKLSTDHQVYAVRISDPAEQNIPALGTLQFMVSGDEHGIPVDTLDARIRQKFTDSARQLFESRQQLLSSLGISCVTVQTNIDNVESYVPIV
jgi:uncharacterized protein (DUF58 family)